VFNKYYEEELAFLRELGAEFARANPQAAPYLAERGADPDVERLLEGFAFLSGRLRQKLDDEMPELVQGVTQLLWPHYLRPVPPLTVLQFEPQLHMVREPQTIPRDSEVDSVPVDGTVCRFRTAFDVEILPLTMEGAVVERAAATAGHLTVTFRLGAGAKPGEIAPARLRFFLHGEPATVFGTHLQLTRRLKHVVVRPSGAGAPDRELILGADAVRRAGFGDEEALLPYPRNVFPGYRLLQEYFALPQKFVFLDLVGLPRLSDLGVTETFEVRFVFAAAPESPLRLAPDNVRLHCVPAVNLFSAQSDPIRIDHKRTEYPVRAAGRNPAHTEIFSVDRVTGWVRGTVEPRVYPSFYSFRHEEGDGPRGGVIYFQTRLRESVLGQGVDTHVAFVSAAQESALPPTETAVLDLTCTNRHLPSKLRVGDLNRSTGSTPEFAKFRNITLVTPSVTPPLGGDLHWRLISNLSLNYLSLTSVEALRGILGIYNFQALRDRQAARENELRLSGIVGVRASPEERLYRGAAVRGLRIDLDMKEDNFAGEGEMVLFAGVLNEFLSQYCTLNSFVHLVVHGTQHGETYSWSPRMGQLSLV
jgi:type VI secretion system protein ImpG